MVNIRVSKLIVSSEIKIDIYFTSTLSNDIGIDNIVLSSLSPGVSAPVLSSVSVSSNVLTLNVRPLVPNAQYKAVLESTNDIIIRGSKGETFIEDGATNHLYFLGLRDDNSIRDAIINELPPIYNKDNSLVFDVIDSESKEILKSNRSAHEVESASYVSVEITDEQIIRGNGPFDIFAKEGVYKLLRVGKTKTGSTDNGLINFDEFPSDPISLQQIFVSEEEVSNISDDTNKFDGLLITLSKAPVIKITSIVLIRDNVEYTYDIEQYKYGIYENKYDGDNSYPAVDIAKNQIRLSVSAVGTLFPYPQGSDTIFVSYYYKKLGRDISSNTVAVTTSINIIRENVPSVSTAFFLKNAPIVDDNGATETFDGVQWLDPEANYDESVKHPAFITELKYNSSNLPKNVGEYSVNYETGQVFVFGEDGSGLDGTTIIPPVATYKYLKTYQDGLDYVFSSDLDEIVSLPNRTLRGGVANITFKYEDTFADGTDYSFSSHVEVLNERAENRLIENIGIKTKNSPITEVFKIFNETTGELYSTSRIIGNQVYFSAVNPPVTKSIERETVDFEQIAQSQLVITDTLTVTGKPFVVYSINLPDNEIMSGTNDFIGANFNTSLYFSEKEIFIREFYYTSSDSINTNLVRLEQVGDYMVDYVNGITYLAVNANSTTAIGDAIYKRSNIKTRNKHITRVDDVYKNKSITSPNILSYDVLKVNDETVEVDDLTEVGEVERLSGSVYIPITVESDSTIIVSTDIHRLRGIYQVTDLKTMPVPINFSDGAIFLNNVITLNSSGIRITDEDLQVQISGTRKYINADRIQDLFASGLSGLVSCISIHQDGYSTNLYTYGSDGYVSNSLNRIYLPTNATINTGDYVTAIYRASLNPAAAVLVDYSPGDLYIDYTYCEDELLIDYEYGDNSLDWSISDSLSSGENYYVTYRYGALRNALRDNFGVLTGIEELSNIPDELDRETYRNALMGSLQTFLKGPTIPAIKQLVKSITQINPNITESVFLEWLLNRDMLYLSQLKLDANTNNELPTFAPGKFGNGLLLDKNGQSATLPFSSNMRMEEGTWEAFVTPNWNGIDNDATITFDILFDGLYNENKIFIGSNNENPDEIPFSLNKSDNSVVGRPTNIHTDTGYFIWYDITAKKWRMRVRAPVSEERLFSGNITTTGEFHNVKIASTADGYEGYDGYEISEENDILRSTDTKIKFAFIVDSYDYLNTAFDAYDAYGLSTAGFDGIDFTSDNLHYFFDAGLTENKNRISLYKDGKGTLKFKIWDNNKRVKILNADISDWNIMDTHHLAVSWRISTSVMQDEMHLFIDGEEVPNTYRFAGFVRIPDGYGIEFLDPAMETIVANNNGDTIGSFDLTTAIGSNIVTSLSSNFIANIVGKRFIILEDTLDGINTQTSPYVYVKSILNMNQVELEIGPSGSSINYNLNATLQNVTFSINPLQVETVADTSFEEIRIFSTNGGDEIELHSPISNTPQYEFLKDGYKDYVNIYGGLNDGYDAILKTYGLTTSRYKQMVYIWGDETSNIMRTIMPPPTSVSKVNITAIIVKRTLIDLGTFALIATMVGTELVSVLVGSLDFCQPTNDVTGRTMSVTLLGDNIDFTGLNEIIIVGATTDGYGYESVSFTDIGTKKTTRFFTEIVTIATSITPIDIAKPAGAVEIRESYPINWQENSGDYAEVRLSTQDQTGLDGVVTIGDTKFSDAYARFGSEDIGKLLNIISPSAIAGSYIIQDVDYDPSMTVKDSDTVTLNTTWLGSYTDIEWHMLNTSHSDSGFANGLITLEIANSGGQPYLLRSCWYEVDFLSHLIMPFDRIPETLYIGSDLNSQNQANAVIDELRILDEMSNDTGIDESAPSSGRSLTVDSNTVKEFADTTQTLALFHFNDNITNYASFSTSFEKGYRQSENSINSNFGQSAVFTNQNRIEIANNGVFFNNEGTIEFWISPILDTFNDPTPRYYLDITSEESVEVTAKSAITIILPTRARTIISVIVNGSDTNYFTAGKLSSDGITITLGQSLPGTTRDVIVTYIPITSMGDRFSILKNEVGSLVFSITGSDTDYQISSPIYWEKNSWHRVFVGWDLNNIDNQDRMIMMVDGTECGTIRYGTGLLYGSGNLYGQPTVWGSATIGTTSARNLMADINFTDLFNTIYVGSDFSNQYIGLCKIDNMRFSNELRTITTVGGTGPGQSIGKDLLYTSNLASAQPVVSDAITTLLLDFNTTETKVEYLATVRNNSTGIFDFYVEIIDSFELASTELIKDLMTDLINRAKPAHTRAFVSFTE